MNPHPSTSLLTFVLTFSSPLVGFSSSSFTLFILHVLAMFSLPRMISSVSVALVLVSVSSVFAVPVPEAAPLTSRANAIPSPAFVVYTDRFVDANVLPPATSLAVSDHLSITYACR